MELQGFMERQKIPSYFLNVTKSRIKAAHFLRESGLLCYWSCDIRLPDILALHGHCALCIATLGITIIAIVAIIIVVPIGR